MGRTNTTIDTRNRRYRLRGVARKWGVDRVKRCGRVRIAEVVKVHKRDGVAHFTGIETCGSIWSCPVCAAHITEQRRLEVRQAMSGHCAEGGAVYMIAFTAAHYRGQRLKPLKDAISGGWSKLIAGKVWKRIKRTYGLSGYIRALEATWGTANGWHPHVHTLLFVDRVLSEDERAAFEADLFDRWDRIIRREGGTPCNPDVFRLERCATPEAAGNYVAKWGADAEITKLHSKSAKGGGQTPWDMLDLAANGGHAAGRRFREFCRTMKGARHLTWSQGLKRRFGIGDVSDDQAAEDDTSADVVMEIAGRDFDRVRDVGAELRVLKAVEAGGPFAAEALINEIVATVITPELIGRREQYFDGTGPFRAGETGLPVTQATEATSGNQNRISDQVSGLS